MRLGKGRPNSCPAFWKASRRLRAFGGAIAEGPGGAAEMVPGQRHVRMNMYLAQVIDGSLRIVKNLGVIDPNERVLPAAQAA